MEEITREEVLCVEAETAENIEIQTVTEATEAAEVTEETKAAEVTEEIKTAEATEETEVTKAAEVMEVTKAPGAEESYDSDLVGVVGVRFRTAGKSYYFSIGELPVRRGTHVVVETARGLEYGISVCDPMKIHQKQFKAPIKKIVRVASEADEKRVKENREKEREAFRVCFEKIREHELDMKLIDAEYTFDSGKLLFYFTSDGRVDFRNLVKDLAGIFHTRIELRQIGVRDETKILGGYGICGRPLCCHTYLADFAPVSIKMAKEQNLSLNPTKISGSCGRLMCCLKNEEETYEELNKSLPRLGDEVQTEDGLVGSVISVNILKQTVRILVEIDDGKEVHESAADALTILHRRKRGQAKPKVNRAELKNAGRSVRPGIPSAKGTSEKEGRSDKPEPGERGSRAGRSEQEEAAEPAGRSERRVRGKAENSGENRPERTERRERERVRSRRSRRDRQGADGSANPELTENAGKEAGKEAGNGASGNGMQRDKGAKDAAGRGGDSRNEAPRDNEAKAAGTGTDGARRRHRYRRRNNNDRRREEKPSAAE